MHYFRLLLFLLLSTLMCPLRSDDSLAPDHLIRTAGIVTAGLILCGGGVYALVKSDEKLSQRIYNMGKGISCIALGITLIVLSSQLIGDVDCLLHK